MTEYSIDFTNYIKSRLSKGNSASIGIEAKTTDGYVYLYSRETANAKQRPTLKVKLIDSIEKTEVNDEYTDNK